MTTLSAAATAAYAASVATFQGGAVAAFEAVAAPLKWSSVGMTVEEMDMARRCVTVSDAVLSLRVQQDGAVWTVTVVTKVDGQWTARRAVTSLSDIGAFLAGT